MGYKTSLSNHLDRSMSASTGKTRVQYQPYHFHTDSSPIQSSTPDTTLKSIPYNSKQPTYKTPYILPAPSNLPLPTLQRTLTPRIQPLPIPTPHQHLLLQPITPLRHIIH